MWSHGPHHHGRSHARERLKVLKSPVAESSHDNTKNPKQEAESTGDYNDYSQAVPDFHRYAEPTLLEIFYDLFFAANYNVYSENQDNSNHSRFKASIGYFCLLWITWFVTTAYDVRFLTDSIFERTARALQLGVLVGFVVVAPNFNPDEQNLQTMRTMSLILMFSRIFLVMEYVSTLWHARKYKKSRLPLYLQIAINLVAALIYLGITFRFTKDKNSRVFMTWYFISAAEGILTLLISYFWSILNFTKTHLMKRLSLLTVMLIGDGLVNIAKEVITIVKQPDAWDGLTIGQITAGVATAYFVFLIYFDWLRSSFYLPKLRQLIWAFLHLPFHLALVLFIQAFTQFIIWAKAISVYKSYTDAVNYDDGSQTNLTDITSEFIAAGLNVSTTEFLKAYPPKNEAVQFVINAALKNVSNIPNDFWAALSRIQDGNADFDALPTNVQQGLGIFIDALHNILTSMTNNLFQAFGIDLTASVQTTLDTKNATTGAFQNQLNDKTFERYRLVFAYGYISAGCTLALMTLLTIVARTTKWKPWPIVRVVVVFLLAIGTSLVAVLWYSNRDTQDIDYTASTDKCIQFLESPWVLPTITIVYTIVLVITHIGGTAASDAVKRTATFLSSTSSGKQSTKAESMPMTTWKDDDRKEAENATYDRLDGPSSPEHERQRSEDIGTAYGDPDRPQTGYDPLKQDTEYNGARSPQV